MERIKIWYESGTKQTPKIKIQKKNVEKNLKTTINALKNGKINFSLDKYVELHSTYIVNIHA